MAKKKMTPASQKKVDPNTETGAYTVKALPKDIPSFEVMLEELKSQFGELNSTGTVIGGTIGSLNRKVDSIERLLVQPDYQQKFSLIESELTTIKTEILPELEQSRLTIAKVEEYMRNNASFLTDLLSSEGRLRSIESEVSSLTKRLDKMQSEKRLAWNRTTTVISIIVAIIGTAFGVYFGFLR